MNSANLEHYELFWLKQFLIPFQGEVYKGFSHTYWAFSRTALPQTLSLMADTDEQQAIDVFNLILTYAGLIVNNKGELTSAVIKKLETVFSRRKKN